MQTNRSNAGALVGGAAIIAFGLLALAGQVFRSVNWAVLSPFIVIAVGAVFFVAMFAGGKQTAAFAIPGSIVGGVGIYIMGWQVGDTVQKQSGVRIIKVGGILFIIFGTFFEMIFSSISGMLFPILLIALGTYLVMTRSGLFDGKKDDSSTNSVPPAS